MNYLGKIAVIDADSLAYGAGHSAIPTEAEMKMDNYINKISHQLQSTKIIGFVEAIKDKNIFRNHVAVTKPYKSNRVGKEKPAFTNMMKEYARTKYGFKFCYNLESEDAVSIVSTQLGIENVVKCCCDKDMLTTPGYFHNYFGTKWKLPYYTEIDSNVIHVSYRQATQNLYTQILTGDGDDAINGIVGCGPAKAQEIIEDIDPIRTDGEYERELACAVGRAYKTAHENFNKVKQPLSYEYLLEQARLIYILRRRGDVFTPVTREAWDAL